MDIERCFEILELDRGASLDEAKQAYKDIVNVWHPDRFSNNPRLKAKAERKLKEVNQAHEKVTSFLSSQSEVGLGGKTRPRGEAKGRAKAKDEERYSKAQTEAGGRDKTEVAVEAGTRFVLNTCFHIYTTLRRFVMSQAQKTEPAETDQRPSQSKGDDG